jgi:hypothetical protein
MEDSNRNTLIIAEDLRSQYLWIKSKPQDKQQSGHLRSIVRLIERTSRAEEKNRALVAEVNKLLEINKRLKSSL